MKKLFLFFAFLAFVFSWNASAYNFLGGNLTYKCIGNNQFIFQVAVITDCSGVPLSNNSYVNIYSSMPIQTIVCSLKIVKENTPSCLPSGVLTPRECSENDFGGIKTFEFESAPIDLSNVPPPSSYGYNFETWIFGDNCINCCRNFVPNLGACTFSLRAKMYAYQLNLNNPNNLTWAGNQCDNSPTFTQNPPSFQILNSGIKTIDNFATDLDQDSLVYELSSPTSGYFDCNYLAPYTINNPFPTLIPNLDGSNINRINGQIRFNTTVAGNWQTCVKVKSYRNGQLVSEIFRDFQVQVSNIVPGYFNTNFAPQINVSASSCNTEDTSFISLFAGDTLDFSVQATDINVGQNVKIYAHSSILGDANSSTTSGCANPPCAQMFGYPGTAQEFTPPAPIVERLDTIGYGFTDSAQAGFRIRWISSCSNFPSTNWFSNRPLDVYINVTAKDDQCPTNGITYKVIHIKLFPKPKLAHPVIQCLKVNEQGNVELSISNIPDSTISFVDSCKNVNNLSLAQTISMNRRLSTFAGHKIYRATNLNGPYTEIVSLSNLLNSSGLTTFIDTTTSTQYHRLFYYIRTNSGCGYQNEFDGSDKVSTLFLTSIYGYDTIHLSWNQIQLNANSNNIFLLDSAFQRNGTFNLVEGYDSTTSIIYRRYLPINYDTLVSRVRSENLQAGCTSVSNISKIVLGNNVGVNNYNLKNWNIFPNPSDGNIQIELETNGRTLLNVHNMLGQLVKTVLITNNITNLNLSELPSGAYFIAANGYETKKLVKF